MSSYMPRLSFKKEVKKSGIILPADNIFDFWKSLFNLLPIWDFYTRDLYFYTTTEELEALIPYRKKIHCVFVTAYEEDIYNALHQGWIKEGDLIRYRKADRKIGPVKLNSEWNIFNEYDLKNREFFSELVKACKEIEESNMPMRITVSTGYSYSCSPKHETREILDFIPDSSIPTQLNAHMSYSNDGNYVKGEMRYVTYVFTPLSMGPISPILDSYVRLDVDIETSLLEDVEKGLSIINDFAENLEKNSRPIRLREEDKKYFLFGKGFYEEGKFWFL